MSVQQVDIAIFGNMQVHGGGSRVFVNNIKEWVRHGYRVEMVGYKQAARILPDELPQSVDFKHLGTVYNLTTVLALWRYIRKYRPRVIVGSSHRSNLLLCELARLPGLSTQTWLTVHSDFVHSNKRNKRQKDHKLAEVRRHYPRATGTICVSEGAAKNLQQAAGLDEEKVHTIHNGVLDDSVVVRSKEPLVHPWLNDPDERVFIGIGRLSEQKDFANLITAFGQVRKQVGCRLIILGEGRKRQTLELQIKSEGLENDVELPGFVDNPYAWMARSDVFVSASRWEGFGNVIAEALGLGIPVVSTDCPSGPAEILGNGNYGELVPVEDPEALAGAMIRALEQGGDPDRLKAAAERFWALNTAPRFLRLFGLC